jgi:hypothetical protein
MDDDTVQAARLGPCHHGRSRTEKTKEERPARDASRVLDEHAKRLARTEVRIGALVEFIENRDHLESVANAIRDLEVQARADKAAIVAIKAVANRPVALPTPDELVERALALETVLAGDPLRAREALRRLFVDGRVVLHPQRDGHYVAEGRFLPLVALSETPAAALRADNRDARTALGPNRSSIAPPAPNSEALDLSACDLFHLTLSATRASLARLGQPLPWFRVLVLHRSNLGPETSHDAQLPSSQDLRRVRTSKSRVSST